MGWSLGTDGPSASILEKRIEPCVLERVGGNAPEDVKCLVLKWFQLLAIQGPASYAFHVRDRLDVKEVSLEPWVDDPTQVGSKIICEIEVTPGEFDMCNGKGELDQGCMAFLMDEGSAVSLHIMNVMERDAETISVSQTLNMMIHGQTSCGARLRIISRSVATSDAAGCCKTEIWDVAKRKLVMTGMQIQTAASGTKRKAKM